MAIYWKTCLEDFRHVNAFDGYVVEKIIVEGRGESKSKCVSTDVSRRAVRSAGGAAGSTTRPIEPAWDLPVVGRPVVVAYPVCQVRRTQGPHHGFALSAAGRSREARRGRWPVPRQTRGPHPSYRGIHHQEGHRAILRLKRHPVGTGSGLASWCLEAIRSGLPGLEGLAVGILRDLLCVAAYFEHRITYGLIEAFNNQLARVIHRTCVITGLDYLFLRMRVQSLQRI